MEYKQDGPIDPGILGDAQPGDRVREALQNRPDLGQGGGVNTPDNPGPALAGRTPLLGTLRRSNGMPVIRDQLSGMMG